MGMNCLQMTSTPGCLIEAGQPPVSVIIFTEFGLDANGGVVPYATRYTTSDATPITLAAGQSVVPGACPLVKSDVEYVMLCDTTGPANAPVVTPFIRRAERVYNASTGALITETLTDLALDLVTAYAVAGTVGACGGGDHEFSETIVCDTAGTKMVRRYTMLNGTMVNLGFFDPVTDAAVTPVGVVGPCPNCVAVTPAGVVTTWGGAH